MLLAPLTVPINNMRLDSRKIPTQDVQTGKEMKTAILKVLRSKGNSNSDIES